MKSFNRILLICFMLGLTALTAQSEEMKKLDFKNEAPGTEARAFSSLVGNWRIDRDGARTVYAVDGRKWEQGLMAAGAREKAKALYGERYAEFLDNLEAYRYFPLSVCKEFRSFRNGSIEVSFKAISGRIDQAAGIAFNIKPNGDYLSVRANALENNLVLFKLEQGR